GPSGVGGVGGGVAGLQSPRRCAELEDGHDDASDVDHRPGTAPPTSAILTFDGADALFEVAKAGDAFPERLPFGITVRVADGLVVVAEPGAESEFGVPGADFGERTSVERLDPVLLVGDAVTWLEGGHELFAEARSGKVDQLPGVAHAVVTGIGVGE